MNFNQNLCTIRKFNVKNTFHVSQRSTQIPVLIWHKMNILESNANIMKNLTQKM